MQKPSQSEEGRALLTPHTAFLSLYIYMVLYVHHKVTHCLADFSQKISFLNVSNNYVLHCLSVVYVLKLIHYQINILARTFSLKKEI